MTLATCISGIVRVLLREVTEMARRRARPRPAALHRPGQAWPLNSTTAPPPSEPPASTRRVDPGPAFRTHRRRVRALRPDRRATYSGPVRSAAAGASVVYYTILYYTPGESAAQLQARAPCPGRTRTTHTNVYRGGSVSLGCGAGARAGGAVRVGWGVVQCPVGVGGRAARAQPAVLSLTRHAHAARGRRAGHARTPRPPPPPCRSGSTAGRSSRGTRRTCIHSSPSGRPGPSPPATARPLRCCASSPTSRATGTTRRVRRAARQLV
jgi:hypothetical protein